MSRFITHDTVVSVDAEASTHGHGHAHAYAISATPLFDANECNRPGTVMDDLTNAPGPRVGDDSVLPPFG